MTLTEHQRTVLRELCTYHQLSTEQCYELFKICPHAPAQDGRRRAVRFVLQRIARRKNKALLVRRYFHLRGVNRRGLPIYHSVYRLTEHGLRIARELGLDPAHRGKANDEKGVTTIDHEQDITDFHFALNGAAGSDVWWRQARVAHDAVNPDAVFYFQPYYYFLEIERSAKRSDLASKFERYDEYRRYRKYVERWPDMKGFYLLLVVCSRTRRDGLVRALDARRSASFIQVAYMEDVRSNILGKIWHSPNGARLAFEMTGVAPTKVQA